MEGSSRDRSPLRHHAAANNLGLMPSFDNSTAAYNNPSFTASLDQSQYFSDSQFDAYSQAAQQPAGLGLDDLASFNYNSTDHLSPHNLNHSPPAPEGFPGLEAHDSLDNTLFNDLDLLQQPSLNFTNGQFNNMSTTLNTTSPTPPHLLPQMARKSSSPSPRTTPNMQQSPFVQRPRNTSESLDPASANYLGQNVDWGHIQGQRGHRRMHSDALSDISSHSAHASPFLPTMDSFDNHTSPLLNPQDPILGDGLGIAQFSISDQMSYHSPAHSPHISPRLGAQQQQQPLPQFTAADGFGLGGAYVQPNVLDSFGQEAFPLLDHGASPGEVNQLDHMSPPEINIITVPEPKPIETSRPSLGEDNLLPPRGARPRSSTNPEMARATSPSFSGRSRSPSQPDSSLSPYIDSKSPSRDASPARGRNGSIPNRGRSNSDQRDYILELAERSRSPGETRTRPMKNPPTFACHLCPKRFTRAYNLRSHLRTHTDERPFVCTVCDKAFARQHDRKRHESLHSGERKFVCRGPLQNGHQWGCGRRFARADALGRHFRSEAGRVCIKPLLEEDAAEQQQQAMWQEQQAHAGMQMPFFPAALLQQYPALAGFDWNQPQANIPEDDYAGRGSFDASSGGEIYDEVSENELGIGPMAVNGTYGLPQQQMNSYSGHQMGDFTNGFEGR